MARISTITRSLENRIYQGLPPTVRSAVFLHLFQLIEKLPEILPPVEQKKGCSTIIAITLYCGKQRSRLYSPGDKHIITASKTYGERNAIMKRTKLAERILPDYTRGEEVFNFVSHIVGGSFGVMALAACILIAVMHRSVSALVGGIIYGVSLIALYTVSSVYHALKPGAGKKVMQVIDHCTIYFLIGGTYTPILLCSIREVSPAWAWTIFGIVWGLAAMAATFTAIDLKKYSVLSMVCYIGMGWCIVIAAKTAIEAIALPGLMWLLAGGISYTVGAVLYGLGKKKRYMHSIFHLFVVLGSVLQFVCIAVYVL